jgi:glycosyltransferase involved in cell wall biosynthesis
MTAREDEGDRRQLLSIVMPVYNEAAMIAGAIQDVLDSEYPVPFELIVVDDGSADGTSEILDSTDWPASVRIFRHPRNKGKGAAVRTGRREVRGDYTAIFDADREYEARDLTQLVLPLLEGNARAVFGVRAFNGYTSHSFLFVLGNRAVTLVANVLYNVYLRDLMTCHKVMRTDLFRSLSLTANGFAIEPEITARLLARGEEIYEIPVAYKARSNAAGKKLTARDGLRAVGMLLRCRFIDRRG